MIAIGTVSTPMIDICLMTSLAATCGKARTDWKKSVMSSPRYTNSPGKRAMGKARRSLADLFHHLFRRAFRLSGEIRGTVRGVRRSGQGGR